MEENNSQKVNLGNLNNQVVPPVTNLGAPISQPIDSQINLSTAPQVTYATTGLSQTVESQSIQPNYVQTSTTAVLNDQETEKQATEEQKPIEPISSDIFEVNVDKLQTMVANAIKIATGDPRTQMTRIIQLKFSSEGFQILVRDKENFLFQTDTTRTYTKDFSFGVDSVKFSTLVNKLDTGTVEMIYNQETRVIELIAPYGKFKFPEVYDSTGQSCNFELDSVYLNQTISYKPFAAKAFQTIIKNIFPFATSFESVPQTSGVYCADVVSATNKNVLGLQKNITDLVNDKFYLSNKFATVYQSLTLFEDKDESLKIGYIRNDQGRIDRIIIRNKYMILAGPTKAQDSFESNFEAALNAFRNANTANNTIFMKDKLSSTLDRLSIFMNDTTDAGIFNLKVENGILNIKTLANDLNENLVTKNNNYTIPEKRLMYTDIKNTLKALGGDEITLSANSEVSDALFFIHNDVTIILTLVA